MEIRWRAESPGTCSKVFPCLAKRWWKEGFQFGFEAEQRGVVTFGWEGRIRAEAYSCSSPWAYVEIPGHRMGSYLIEVYFKTISISKWFEIYIDIYVFFWGGGWAMINPVRLQSPTKGWTRMHMGSSPSSTIMLVPCAKKGVCVCVCVCFSGFSFKNVSGLLCSGWFGSTSCWRTEQPKALQTVYGRLFGFLCLLGTSSLKSSNRQRGISHIGFSNE